MRFRLIDSEKPHHAVSRLARTLGVSRSGHHAWRRRRPSARSLADAALAERIEAIHEASRGIYGAPRIQAELADDHAICVGTKLVARLMRDLGIAGVAAESFFSTIKTELIYRHTSRGRNAARLAIFDYIERFYNPVRRHSTLGNKSPVNYELAAAAATT